MGFCNCFKLGFLQNIFTNSPFCSGGLGFGYNNPCNFFPYYQPMPLFPALGFNLPTFNYTPYCFNTPSIFTQQNTQNYYSYLNFDTFNWSNNNFIPYFTPRISTSNVEQKSTDKVNDSNNSASFQELKEKWSKKKPNLNISDDFYMRVIKISEKIQCDPNDLMGVIDIETGGKFSASAQNKITKATGLIQFMPKTAEGLGTSIENLAKMTEIEQLDYVEKYFEKCIKSHKIQGQIDGATLYAMVFWPVASNKEDDYLITNKGTEIYKYNSVLDANKDDRITKSDLGEIVLKHRA